MINVVYKVLKTYNTLADCFQLTKLKQSQTTVVLWRLVVNCCSFAWKHFWAHYPLHIFWSVDLISISRVPLYTAERRRHVCLPVHEALHSRGDLSASSPQFLPPSSQQLLRPLEPIPPPRGLVAWPKSLWHLEWSFTPDERQLPCSAEMPRLWSGLLFTLLRGRPSQQRPPKAFWRLPEGSHGVPRPSEFPFKKKLLRYLTLSLMFFTEKNMCSFSCDLRT